MEPPNFRERATRALSWRGFAPHPTCRTCHNASSPATSVMRTRAHLGFRRAARRRRYSPVQPTAMARQRIFQHENLWPRQRRETPHHSVCSARHAARSIETLSASPPPLCNRTDPNNCEPQKTPGSSASGPLPVVSPAATRPASVRRGVGRPHASLPQRCPHNPCGRHHPARGARPSGRAAREAWVRGTQGSHGVCPAEVGGRPDFPFLRVINEKITKRKKGRTKYMIGRE